MVGQMLYPTTLLLITLACTGKASGHCGFVCMPFGLFHATESLYRGTNIV